MKIILKDKAYLDRSDIEVLKRIGYRVPECKECYDGLFLIEDKESIDYVKSLSFIYDFNDIKNLNTDEIMSMINEINEDLEKRISDMEFF